MKRRLACVLVALPFALAGCGGSSATPKTAAGVEGDLSQFAHLLAGGQAQKACERYVTSPLKAQLAALGGCAKLLDGALASSGPLNVRHALAGFTATVRGERATYRTATGGGTAVYVDGHWTFGGLTSPANS